MHTNKVFSHVACKSGYAKLFSCPPMFLSLPKNLKMARLELKCKNLWLNTLSVLCATTKRGTDCTMTHKTEYFSNYCTIFLQPAPGIFFTLSKETNGRSSGQTPFTIIIKTPQKNHLVVLHQQCHI